MRDAGLKTIAVFEAAKGALVLLAGFGLLELLHRNAQTVAEEIVRQLHLNPASRYPRIFLHLAEQATPTHLKWLAAGAVIYALVRFAEAYGLWRARKWAEWLAVVSGGLYLPIEIYKLTHGLTWARVSMLLGNLAVVAYLAWCLTQGRLHRRPPAPPAESSPPAPDTNPAPDTADNGR